MNKKYLGIVAGLLLLAGCSNDDFIADKQAGSDGVKTISSITAKLDDTAFTRAFLGDADETGMNKRMYWDRSDRVFVYSDAATDLNTYQLTNLTDDNVATFTGAEIKGRTFYALYGDQPESFTVDENNPNLVHYSRLVIPAAEETDDLYSLVPMVATSTGTDFSFKQVMGMVHIKVGGIHELTHAEFYGNNGEAIWGDGTIDLSKEQPEFKLDDDADATGIGTGLAVNLDETNVDIYFAIPPTKFEKGFTVKLYGTDEYGNEVVVEKSSPVALDVKVATVTHFDLIDMANEPHGDSPAAVVDRVLTNAYASFFNTIEGQWSSGASYLLNYVFGDVAGADANTGSQETDQPDFRDIMNFHVGPANSYVSSKWFAVYNAVDRANQVISYATRYGNDIPDVEQVIAQAKFIKAVWMFEGIRMFGAAIPYPTVEDFDEGKGINVVEPSIPNHNNGTYLYIWKQVEQDLKDAIEDLPETWSGNDEGRATSWMAKAMLAKLYLYWSSPYNGTNGTANHWADAKTYLDDVMNNGVNAQGQKYALANRYSDLFDPSGSGAPEESVFDIQVMFGYYTGLPIEGKWGFYQPTNEFVNSFIVDEDGLPAADYTSYEPLTKRRMDNWGFETNFNTPVDPRVDVNAGRQDVTYWDKGPVQTFWIRSIGYAGPYVNKKFRPRRATYFYTDKNLDVKYYPVIRFADILLMRAECAIQEGDLATALSLINQVRSRAANDRIDGQVNYKIGLYSSFANAAEAQTALEREMRAEFGMEGHRWFDIARWGKAASVLNTFRAYENQLYTPKYPYEYNQNWVTFPIPMAAVLNSNGVILQNVNWKDAFSVNTATVDGFDDAEDLNWDK